MRACVRVDEDEVCVLRTSSSWRLATDSCTHRKCANDTLIDSLFLPVSQSVSQVASQPTSQIDSQSVS